MVTLYFFTLFHLTLQYKIIYQSKTGNQYTLIKVNDIEAYLTKNDDTTAKNDSVVYIEPWGDLNNENLSINAGPGSDNSTVIIQSNQLQNNGFDPTVKTTTVINTNPITGEVTKQIVLPSCHGPQDIKVPLSIHEQIQQTNDEILKELKKLKDNDNNPKQSCLISQDQDKTNTSFLFGLNKSKKPVEPALKSTFKPVHDNKYQIRIGNGKYLCSDSNDKSLKFCSTNNQPGSVFHIHEINGYIKFINQGLCMSILNRQKPNGHSLGLLECKEKEEDQRFYILDK